MYVKPIYTINIKSLDLYLQFELSFNNEIKSIK